MTAENSNVLKSIDKQITELPTEVAYCTKCVTPNQRPRMSFDEHGVCAACRYQEEKETSIDWDSRSKELEVLLDRHRSKTGDFDGTSPTQGEKSETI